MVHNVSKYRRSGYIFKHYRSLKSDAFLVSKKLPESKSLYYKGFLGCFYRKSVIFISKWSYNWIRVVNNVSKYRQSGYISKHSQSLKSDAVLGSKKLPENKYIYYKGFLG